MPGVGCPRGPAPGTLTPAGWRTGLPVGHPGGVTFTDEQYQAVVDRAAEQDRRRRHQVDVQREAINRLAAGAGQPAVDLAVMEELAAARARLERVADVVAAAPNRRSKLVKDLAFLVEDD